MLTTLKLAGLSLVLQFASLAQAAPPTASSDKPRDGRTAVIEAIRDNVVTVRSSNGLTRRFEVAAVAGLRPGQQVAWCEDDCRVLSVVLEVPVRRSLR